MRADFESKQAPTPMKKLTLRKDADKAADPRSVDLLHHGIDCNLLLCPKEYSRPELQHCDLMLKWWCVLGVVREAVGAD